MNCKIRVNKQLKLCTKLQRILIQNKNMNKNNIKNKIKKTSKSLIKNKITKKTNSNNSNPEQKIRNRLIMIGGAKPQ